MSNKYHHNEVDKLTLMQIPKNDEIPVYVYDW